MLRQLSWILSGALGSRSALAAAPAGALDLEYRVPTPAATAQQAIASSADILRILLGLALVLGLIYAAYWLMLKWRNRQGAGAPGQTGLINVLERQFIDVRHGLAVVEVGEEVLALGLGENVTLLARISDPDTVERLRTRARPSAGMGGFREQLERVGLRLRREEWGQAKESMRRQSEELREQADKLSKRRKGEP